MPFWQSALLLLAVLWIGQAVGTWFQMKHYRQVMGGITAGWPDGMVGASASRGLLRRGVVAIVVADSAAVVRQVFVMEGRSVFAKFSEIPVTQGVTLAGIDAEPALGAGPRARRTAISGAIRQIEARRARAEAATGIAIAA